MYELIQITDKSYYIQSPAKIGVVKISDNEVILVGSTVKSYLSWLTDNSVLEVVFENNMKLWRKVNI